MNKFAFSCLIIVASFFLLGHIFGYNHAQASSPPNFIIVLTDDQGYQDLGVYGSPKIKTPNLDNMANEGLHLSNFYVASSVCSASRAALLTGRLGIRTKATGVYFPDSLGLNTQEVTIAEYLQKVGYKTAMYGKWHLGDRLSTLPTAQGFDEYFGIPYSNDMYIGANHNFAEDVKFTHGYSLAKAQADQAFVKEMRTQRAKIKEKGIKELVPIMEASSIIEYPAQQETLTQRYFEKTMAFIEENKETPFFVFLSPAMPHVPLFAPEQFTGKSEGGLYGDVIEEIDWYMGKLNAHLKQLDIDENTLIIFTSDNGPWLGYKNHAGSAGLLRDGKFSNFEGGVKVPAVFYWPNRIKAQGLNKALVSSLDILPTLLELANAGQPKTALDGISISKLFTSDNQATSEREIFYSASNQLAGIRLGAWKYLRKGAASLRKSPLNETAYLFDLSQDFSEKNNLILEHPDIVDDLENRLIKLEASVK